MACTTDSGTETLFSDESPCELVRSPSVCSGDETVAQNDDTLSVNSRLAPPNIQPFSGVLEKGKVVIRPIAFKPPMSNVMAPSARFGERYGSTPILTRPGSRLTLYGSTSDLHRQNGVQNYSLDRKLRSSCPSATSSSPPLAMSSLPSLPHSHKLINYDSLESVRKSPVLINKPSYRHSTSNMDSLMDLTPSPSDSGVSELEAALRDRDSELAYLRQTMEHNEQVIFRVYQEKEKVWEKELRRLKVVHENRLRASAQKSLKLEQMLMMQSYQLNQDKKRLLGDVQKANFQNEKLKQEVAGLRNRLEETEWGLCQKTGEISLLKTQLKECQNDQTAKCQELLQLRTEFRELQQQLATEQKDIEISDMRAQLAMAKDQLRKYQSVESIDKGMETERLRAEIKELREELSDMSLSDYSNAQPGRTARSQNQCNEDEVSLEDLEIQKLNVYGNPSSEAEKLRKELEVRTREFASERLVWAQEKEKVLRYQRQLQMNYVQMYRRNKALESEVKHLSEELDSDRKEAKTDLTQTVEL